MDDQNDKFLLRKISDVDTKLENHIFKVESKLDTIVSIMQQVTMLQERASHNSEDISEIKTNLKEAISSFNTTITRVHTRLDEIERSRVDCSRQCGTDIKGVEVVLQSRFDGFKKEAETTHQILNSNTQEIDMKVSRWMNRGIGIWTAASIFVVILQAIGGFLLSNMKDDYSALKGQVGNIEKKVNDIDQAHTLRMNENDQNVSQLWQEVRRGGHVGVKR